MHGWSLGRYLFRIFLQSRISEQCLRSGFVSLLSLRCHWARGIRNLPNWHREVDIIECNSLPDVLVRCVTSIAFTVSSLLSRNQTFISSNPLIVVIPVYDAENYPLSVTLCTAVFSYLYSRHPHNHNGGAEGTIGLDIREQQHRIW